MSLASVVNVPPTGPSGWKEWAFNHYLDHLTIVQAIKAKFGIIMPTYVIDPLNEADIKGWALRHQNYHNDMNSVLGLNGVDLQVVDFKNDEDRESWMFLNFEEHRAAHIALGGGL